MDVARPHMLNYLKVLGSSAVLRLAIGMHDGYNGTSGRGHAWCRLFRCGGAVGSFFYFYNIWPGFGRWAIICARPEYDNDMVGEL